MGYRNQPVIQDFYGLKDLAKATSQIGTSAARAVDKINASFRLAQDIAKKENSALNILKGKSQLEDSKIVQGLKNKNNLGDPELVTQAIDEIENYMMSEDGSVNAKAILKSGKNLTRDERKMYQDRVNVFEDMISNFTSDGAAMLTDKNLFDTFDDNTMFYSGNDPYERQMNLLAATTTYGKPSGDGIKQIGRKKDGRNVSYTYEVKANHPQFKDLEEFQNLKTVDGKKTVTWARDMATWDGNFIDKMGIKAADYNESGKGSGSLQEIGGKLEISENYRTTLPTVVMNGSNEQSVDVGSEFVDVNGFIESMSSSWESQANAIWSEMQQGGGKPSANAFLRKNLKHSGVDYMQKFVDGDMTEDDIIGTFEKLSKDEMLEHFGLRDGDMSNGLRLTKRALTESDIKMLIDRKIPGAVNLSAGDDGYFYESEKASGKDNTEIKTWKLKMKNLLGDSTSRVPVYGNKTSVGTNDNKMIVWNAALKQWEPQTRDANISTKADDDTRVSMKAWQPAKGKDIPTAGSPKSAYNNWLGY
tara:strand:+ start:9661 stop:11253 length:1593 start_codon:yes stop_codon:yes gene_type:complete